MWFTAAFSRKINLSRTVSPFILVLMLANWFEHSLLSKWVKSTQMCRFHISHIRTGQFSWVHKGVLKVLTQKISNYFYTLCRVLMCESLSLVNRFRETRWRRELNWNDCFSSNSHFLQSKWNFRNESGVCLSVLLTDAFSLWASGLLAVQMAVERLHPGAAASPVVTHT